jgi:hypothetical protein
MNVQQELRTRRGEREFLDYPVFLEAGVGERSALLLRTLIAALGVAVIALALIVFIK